MQLLHLMFLKFTKDSSVTLTGKQYPIFTEPINVCQLWIRRSESAFTKLKRVTYLYPWVIKHSSFSILNVADSESFKERLRLTFKVLHRARDDYVCSSACFLAFYLCISFHSSRFQRCVICFCYYSLSAPFPLKYSAVQCIIRNSLPRKVACKTVVSLLRFNLCNKRLNRVKIILMVIA